MKKVLALFLCSIIAGGTSLSLSAQETTIENETLDLQFYASPSQVVKGDRVRLDWESEDADYCTASGSWVGQRETSGSVKVIATKKTATYELECFDEEGNRSEKIVRHVTVITSKKKLPKRKNLPIPTPEIDAQSHARSEEEVEIAWSSPKGTVACWATGPNDWEGLKKPNSSGVFSAEIGKEYSLACWNQNGESGNRVAHVFEKKPSKYTAHDVELSKDYLPMYPDDFTLSNGQEVYFIDFIKQDERDPNTLEDDLYYWGKRIVIDPSTNLRIEDKDVLEQLNAFPGQVPPDVIPSLKLIKADGPISYNAAYESYKDANDDLSRFVNDDLYDGAPGNSKNAEIPVLSPDEVYALAIEYTLEHLDLPKTQNYKDLYKASTLAIWFNGSVAGVPMFYETTVYDWKDEKIRQIVIDPYTGQDNTEKGIFEAGAWDRTILTKREPLSMPVVKKPIVPLPSPTPIKGEPVGNPPTQTPLLPPTPTPDTISCSTPKSLCKNICVDLENDRNNCGACGTSCGALSCVRGVCDAGPDAKKTPTICPAGSTFSSTLHMCVVQDTPQTTQERPSCPEGQSYSITFKQCFK